MLLLDRDRLDMSRTRIADGDPTIAPAWHALRQQADEALTARPKSVMDKVALPASGNKHDFCTLSVYWWPNPDSSDGLPYIRRDGYISPKVTDYDWPNWDETGDRIRACSLAWYFTADRRYADHAARLMRTWFLDPETAMTPHMQYAACIPGRADGRCFGIIHMANNLPSLVDMLELLREAGAWTAEDQDRFYDWLSQLYEWLTTSDRGKAEGSQANNHAVMYDRFVSALALHLGRTAEARERLAAVPERRLTQIEPDGRMPKELGRTRSWHYSVMALNAFFSLAKLAEAVNLPIDLWRCRHDGTGTIEQAATFLYDHAATDEPWPYVEVKSADYGLFVPVLEQARAVYGDRFDLARITHRMTADDAGRQHHLTGRHEEFY